MQIEALRTLANYFLYLFAGAACLAAVLYFVKSSKAEKAAANKAEAVPPVDLDIYPHGASEEIKRGRVAYSGLSTAR